MFFVSLQTNAILNEYDINLFSFSNLKLSGNESFFTDVNSRIEPETLVCVKK